MMPHHTFSLRVKRADLHCHSIASTEADEAALIAIGCPESFSAPPDVYLQAKSRGMDFATITDHDSVDGVAQILHHTDVLSGEEVTCYFPEDGCKMHVLVWGLSREDHVALQAVASDIYEVARYVEEQQLAHSVAHPVYRQNDVLERWHLERLILLFKGFECLNGAHSPAHRDAFEPVIDALTPQAIDLLARRHKLPVRWSEPWKKSRTGGSDDHALLNVGRTWTEFPAECTTIADLLECIRTARCQPGGEAGSSIKLAHNFLGVAARYAAQRMGNNDMLQMLVGSNRAMRKRDMIAMAAKTKLRRIGRRVRRGITRGFRGASQPHGGAEMLGELMENSLTSRLGQHGAICDALRCGRAPLAEHDALFALMAALNRDVTAGIVAAVTEGIQRGDLAPVFDAISAIFGQQLLMFPYYFALFHQNRERAHFPRITGYGADRNPASLRVGIFTDTFDGSGDLQRFTRSIATAGDRRGLSVRVHTCDAQPASAEPWRKNFTPLASAPLGSQRLTLPPIAEVLEWVDRQQFDVIHAETFGPMGLLALVAARMLRVPFVAAFQVDVPGIIRVATGDYRLGLSITAAAGWFYQQADAVLTRSRASQSLLQSLGVSAQKMSMLPAEFDASLFEAPLRDPQHWQRRGVHEPHTLLYRGEVTVESNLRLVADAFERLCTLRRDVALIVMGDGPYLSTMQTRLKKLPAYFNPGRSEAADSAAERAADYAASDLLLFPSAIECAAQTVIEAQACGLPVLVSDQGASREMMDDAVSGMVLSASQPREWTDAIDALLNDELRRQRMARTAPQRMTRFARSRVFDMLWDQYACAVAAQLERSGAVARPDGAASPRRAASDVEVTTS